MDLTKLARSQASPEEVAARHEICKGCDQLVAGQCRACGCPIPGKLRFAVASCPLGKWQAIPLPSSLSYESQAPALEPLTLAGMAKSFFGSALKFAASGFPVTPLERLEERLALCASCEHWNADGFGGTGQCRACGCSTQAKLRMATAECPIQKWGAVAARGEG